ncbi:MAG: ABC transporter ATP-binding protein [Desulfovibrio sp.]|nr:ABC transporter ATP-binding protein [Desulfovibrio sp.]
MASGLSIRNLFKEYPGPSRSSAAQVVLSGLNLDVPAGSFVSIVGLNGSGKTTLLRIIAGLEPATSGDIRINGAPPDLSRKAIGMVSQELALLPWRTTYENVALPLELRCMGDKERHARVMRILRVFGLGGCSAQYPRALSGGMRQKVAIARALVAEPDMLLMDEPFSALDCQIRLQLQRFLTELWMQRRDTILFVTHDVEEAVVLSDIVVVISQKPARVIDVISVNLPRLRERATLPVTELRRRVILALQGQGVSGH